MNIIEYYLIETEALSLQGMSSAQARRAYYKEFDRKKREARRKNNNANQDVIKSQLDRAALKKRIAKIKASKPKVGVKKVLKKVGGKLKIIKKYIKRK